MTEKRTNPPQDQNNLANKNGARSCALVIFVVAAFFLGLAISSQRIVIIDQGYRVDSLESSGVVYNVWSYGEWRQRTLDGNDCEVFAPPYTVVLAIHRKTHQKSEVRLHKASVASGGKETPLALPSPNVEKMQLRSASVIDVPYAPFIFEKAIPQSMMRDKDVSLVVEFSLDDQDEIIRQELPLTWYQNKSTSFIFWEMFMGV